MKLVATVAGLALVAITGRPAAACGVPNFGMMMADVAKAFETKTRPLHTPLLEVGGGSTTEGDMVSVNVGYGWGEHEDSWLFPGASLTRVMAGIRSDTDQTSVNLTYGWYTNALGTLALDLGAEAQMSGTRAIGPTARLLVGVSGVGLRFTGGALFGDETRFAGAAELVVEVMDLGSTL